jgi:hypothetical protein
VWYCVVGVKEDAVICSLTLMMMDKVLSETCCADLEDQ